MPSIMEIKKKHRKRQNQLLASIEIFLSSPWHSKKWSDGWEILQIDRNHTDIDISILFIND